MLGRILDRLDEPETAAALLRALDDASLADRLATHRPGEAPEHALASVVRGFLETASDDHWVQMIGIMICAADPTTAVLRAILAQALPKAAA